MRHSAFILIVVCLLCVFSGCATVLSRATNLGETSPGKTIPVYPATSIDGVVAYECIKIGGRESGLLFLGCIIDLSSSLVFDTLLLPLDLFVWSNHSRSNTIGNRENIK